MLDLVAIQSPNDFRGVFVDADGRIRLDVRCSPGMEVLQSWPGCRLLEGEYDAGTTYFVGDTPRPRPFPLRTPDLTISADGAVVDIAVPKGSEILRGSQMLGAAIDGSFEFSTTIPGTYVFEVRPPFPFRDQVLTVTANAP